MLITKAVFVKEIKVEDSDTNVLIEMEVWKHQNGGLFAIDSSFLDQCTDSECPRINDPFAGQYPEEETIVKIDLNMPE